MTDIVGLDPDGVEHLARATERAAAELRRSAADLRSLETGPARTSAAVSSLMAGGTLADVVAWLDGESRALRWLVAEVRSWAGRVPPGVGVEVWSGTAHPSLAAPGPAHRAAVAAALALASGERVIAAALLGEWGQDPVFAVTLLRELGAEGIVRALAAADELWRAPAPHGPEHRQVVKGLALALATASHRPGGMMPVAALARAADRTDHPRRLLGLLFLAPASFSSAFLVGAVRHVVLPINRAVREGASTGAYRVAGSHDARVLVLRAVATEPNAARRTLADVDLDLLLAAELDYLDTGRAVGDLLVAGTAPRTAAGARIVGPLVTGQAADLGLAAANLHKVVDWVAGAGVIAPGVQRRLGEVARPWIGSFRSAGLDAMVTAHVELDEVAARGFLRRASEWAKGARQIREAAWQWATTEVVRLAGRDHGGAAGFAAIGSVLGIVSIAGHDAAAGAAAGSDAHSRAMRDLWDDVAGGALRRVSPWLPAIAGRGVDAVIDRVLPEGRVELTHWREVRDEAIGAEYLLLDYLVVSELWRQRQANHYFDGPDRQPPPSLLIGPLDRGVVRPLAGLDRGAAADYLRWRSALAADRPGPMQAAGERFLAEGREG